MKRLMLAVIAGATMFGTVAASAQSEFNDSERGFRHDTNRFNRSRHYHSYQWQDSRAQYGYGPGVTVDVGPRYRRWNSEPYYYGGPAYYGSGPSVGIGIGVGPDPRW